MKSNNRITTSVTPQLDNNNNCYNNNHNNRNKTASSCNTSPA